MAVALLTAGCGGPFGLRFGLNPEVIAQLKDDPAASCIVIETATAGGTRIIWWRDASPSREGTSMRDCLDPRASPAAWR
jgi:hypothetical protein